MGTSSSKIQCDAPPLPPPGQMNIPPPDAEAPPPPPTSPSQSSPDPAEVPSQPSPSSTTIPNPGPYGQFRRLATVHVHDGFKVDIQKQLSPYMIAIHSFMLGTSLPDGRNKTYNFITQVADDNGLLMANLDPAAGTVGGQIHRALLGGLANGKIHSNVTSEGQSDEIMAEIDFGGMTWTGNLKYGSTGGGTLMGMNYYQGITKGLAMGGEGMYIGANGSLLSSYILKYEMDAPGGDEHDGNVTGVEGGERPSSWFLAQVRPAQGMLDLHYRRVVTPNRVTLGAELNVVPSLESQVSFGAEFQLTRSKIHMGVDGTGKIQTLLETKLGKQPGSPSLNMCADVDFKNDTMKFGYGLNIAGN